MTNTSTVENTQDVQFTTVTDKNIKVPSTCNVLNVPNYVKEHDYYDSKLIIEISKGCTMSITMPIASKFFSNDTLEQIYAYVFEGENSPSWFSEPVTTATQSEVEQALLTACTSSPCSDDVSTPCSDIGIENSIELVDSELSYEEKLAILVKQGYDKYDVNSKTEGDKIKPKADEVSAAVVDLMANYGFTRLRKAKFYNPELKNSIHDWFEIKVGLDKTGGLTQTFIEKQFTKKKDKNGDYVSKLGPFLEDMRFSKPKFSEKKDTKSSIQISFE